MKKISLMVLIGVFFLTGCSSNSVKEDPKNEVKSYAELETAINTAMESFYESTLKGNMELPTDVTVSFDNLKNGGIDVSGLVDKYDNKDCEPTSYSIIHMKEDNSYEIENHFVCGSYSSDNSN